MSLTSEQLAERQKALGASDMAAILGLDPFRTGYDVWLEKTGRVQPKLGDETTDAGQRFEEAVLEWASERLGPIQRGPTFRVPELCLIAHPDGLVVATGDPVEAKTAGLFGPLAEEWGDDETDEVPPRVIIQAQVQLRCVANTLDEPRVCDVPAFLGGRGFVLFAVPWNVQIIGIIEETAPRWWRDCVVADMPPADSLPSLELIKRIRREPNKIVPISAALVQVWLAKKEIKRLAEKDADMAQAALLATLGDAEVGNAGASGTVSYYEITRKAYAVAETTYRKLAYKKAKEIVHV